MEEKRRLEKELQLLKKQSAAGSAQNLISNARPVAGVPVLAMKVEATSMDELRSLGDNLRKELEGIALLGAELDGKTTLLCVNNVVCLKRVRLTERHSASVDKDQCAHLFESSCARGELQLAPHDQ